MNIDSPLAKAHALAGHASTLLKSPSQVSRRQAIKAYDEAADLFQVATSTVEDDTVQTTLQLLMTQNRKQARDLERRLNAESSNQAASSISSSRGTSLIPPSGIETTLLADASRDASSTTNPPRSVPSFARKPPAAPSPQRREIPSPLYSSTSSSDRADESFIHFGGQPDTTDPFARFWGVLETMLEDISNPVAFTSVPLGVGTDTDAAAAAVPVPRPRKASKREKKDRLGTESFYIVPKSSSDNGPDVQKEPVPKTPEELALENESLRASLDALSKHAQALSIENAQLKGGAEKREEMMKSVVLGVKREAQKAIQGQQEFIARSQMLGSVNSAASTWGPRPAVKVPDGEPGAAGLKRRVRELEEELKGVRSENEKQVGVSRLIGEADYQRVQLDKYKEKFDKLKTHAREKREAKLKQSNEAP